jgi:hypothetical protein
MAIAEKLDSYTEISPSGAGLHIIVRANLPEGRRRVGRVELYDQDRFFTVTGRRLAGTPHLPETRQEQIEALHARLFPPGEGTPKADPPLQVKGLDDEEILRRATNAANGERFEKLWSGDRTGYASASEADLALCSMLAFWTGFDEERIASHFARSGLARDKWNRQDYRNRTIARALKGAKFFDPGKESESPSQVGHPSDTESTILDSSFPPTLPQVLEFPIEAMPAACRPLIAEVEKRDAQKAGEPAPEEPEAPTMSRSVASDTIVEALVSILEDNPRGLLLHKDELTGWVRSMDQYKGGKGSDRQHWLSFWSGDEVVVDRKSRQGEPIIVAKPFVSLFGGVQPAMLGELGGGAEDGLMDRFLFCYPAPRHIRFTENEISADAEEEYAALYAKLADLRLATDEHGDPNPMPLKLTRRAKDLFATTVDSLSAEVLEPGFPFRLEGVWSKLRGYLARLSLVLAVCRCTAGRVTEERIEHEDVQAASQLLNYFKAHSKRVYAELSSPDPLEFLAADLKALLEESDGRRIEATATELYRMLEEREAPSLPERAEELSKQALRIGERSCALEIKRGWRKEGGRKGRTRRVLRLALRDPEQENAVGPVVTVGPEQSDPPGHNGTNGTNGNSLPEGAKTPFSSVGEDGGTSHPDEERSRFTL